jgi:menaquinone-dependent protoporphyrinogen oxidase
MCDIPVFYATTEGHTERIAERLAEHFRDRGFSSETFRLGGPDVDLVDWSRARAVVVGASLHGGRHQQEAAQFIQTYRHRLNAGVSAFFSVSLAAASKRPGEPEKARQIAETFTRESGWHPALTASLAGRLAYTQYGFVKRWIMRGIARREGGSTDTTRDHDYTDWREVARFADRVGAAVRAAMAGERVAV